MSVTVVGSLNEDVLITVERLPGRGETVIGGGTVLAPGGKGANQAAAAGLLGPGVHMVGRVGADPAGDRQLAALAGSRVNVSQVHRTAGAPTGSATIPVEEGTGENLIVVVPGANAQLTPAGRRRRVGAPGDRAAAAARGAAGDGPGRGRAHRGHRRPHSGAAAAAARRPAGATSTCWCPTSTSWPSWRAWRPASGRRRSWRNWPVPSRPARSW